jgi:ATP-dependent DNA ligase
VHIAQFLRSTDEVGIAVAYLSGIVRQSKTGIGYATIRDAQPGVHSPSPSLTLADVDAALDRIASTSGAGSAKEKLALLGDLFARATPGEASFLARLLIGELRQGALEGLMIDAVAAAANVTPESVRRAAMAGGGIAAVAATAVREGAAGLARYKLAMFQPLAPMLAQPADDVDDAMARIGGETARASRCTSEATRCACTRAPATRSRPRCPRSWRSGAGSRRHRSSSTAKRSSSARRVRRIRSRSR